MLAGDRTPESSSVGILRLVARAQGPCPVVTKILMRYVFSDLIVFWIALLLCEDVAGCTYRGFFCLHFSFICFF
jgi:hypothetical protein